MVQEKFSTMHEILDKKLNTGELTYARYAGTAEQVCVSVLDNLKYLMGLMKSVGAIGKRYSNSKLEEQREELSKTQLKKIDDLLIQNEEALAQLDNFIAAIADIRLDKGIALADLETARQGLEDMVRRAQSKLTMSSTS